MDNDVRRTRRPLWVRIAFLGVSTRGAAWGSFWLSVAIAIGGVACGRVDRRFYLGGIMVVAVPWYYLAIRWEDDHGDWVL